MVTAGFGTKFGIFWHMERSLAHFEDFSHFYENNNNNVDDAVPISKKHSFDAHPTVGMNFP